MAPLTHHIPTAVAMVAWWQIALALFAAADLAWLITRPHCDRKRAIVDESRTDYVDRWLKRQTLDRAVEDSCWQLHRQNEAQVAMLIAGLRDRHPEDMPGRLLFDQQVLRAVTG